MKRDFFNQQFAALVNAYTIASKLSGEAQDVYWEMLKDIPEAKFADGVRECLAGCKFFPTVAELGEASMPAIPDRRAPLPAIDKERPKINWRAQLDRQKHKELPQVDRRVIDSEQRDGEESES
jgi:hypothetical protein